MTTLLHIDCSSSFLPSKSRHLAAEFRAVWDKANPGGTVTYRDLAIDPIPHLSVSDTKVLAFPPENLEEQASLERQTALIEEILNADEVLISAPMYNWGIPSTLKAWFDQTLVMGKTLPMDPTNNPLAGRPATVLLAYGGDYSPESSDIAMDMCGPYLQTVLGTVLGYDVSIIATRLTLAPFSSEDEEIHRKVEALLADAEEKARARAQETSRIHEQGLLQRSL